LQHPVLSALLA